LFTHVKSSGGTIAFRLISSLIFSLLLSPELLKLASLTFQFRLIAIDLSLLIGLLDLLALELIADQSARAQSERPADSSAGSGMTDGRANNAARRSSTQRTNAGAFLARRQAPAGAARRYAQEQYRKQRGKCLMHRPS
jgi:hypothetical protein